MRRVLPVEAVGPLLVAMLALVLGTAEARAVPVCRGSASLEGINFDTDDSTGRTCPFLGGVETDNGQTVTAANLGSVGMLLEATHPGSGPNVGATTFVRYKPSFLITGPAGVTEVMTQLTLDLRFLIQIMGTPANPFGLPATAFFRLEVDGPAVPGFPLFDATGRVEVPPQGAPTATQGGVLLPALTSAADFLSFQGLVTTPQFVAPVNEAFVVAIEGFGTGNAVRGTAGAPISLLLQLVASLPGNGVPVLDLPDGFTLDSVEDALVENNAWLGQAVQLQVIPEPSTALLMALGLAGLVARRRAASSRR